MSEHISFGNLKTCVFNLTYLGIEDDLSQWLWRVVLDLDGDWIVAEWCENVEIAVGC